MFSPTNQQHQQAIQPGLLPDTAAKIIKFPRQQAAPRALPDQVRIRKAALKLVEHNFLKLLELTLSSATLPDAYNIARDSYNRAYSRAMAAGLTFADLADVQIAALIDDGAFHEDYVSSPESEDE